MKIKVRNMIINVSVTDSSRKGIAKLNIPLTREPPEVTPSVFVDSYLI